MHEQQNKPGGIPEVIMWLGKTVGVAAALFVTPVAFVMSKAAIYAYFAAFLGVGNLTLALTWVIGGLEAVFIFVLITIVVAILISWVAAALVARGFR